MNFNETAEVCQKTVVAEIEAFKDLQIAKNTMEVAGFQVELNVISNAGGDVKKVGSSEADRKRAYEIAKSKSVIYDTARKFYMDARATHKYNQGMVRLLDLRLQFLIATSIG